MIEAEATTHSKVSCAAPHADEGAPRPGGGLDAQVRGRVGELMAKVTQTATGTCPTHGGVQATREVPKITFPFIVFGIMRLFAVGKPYLCPSCGQPVKKD